MAQKTKTKDTSIVSAIHDDVRLNFEEKSEFISLANIFSTDLVANLQKSSVELAEETGIDVDTWRHFLSYPSIKRIIDSFVHEQIKKKADTALISGKGTRDAVNVRKAMLEEASGEDNTRFVIIRLPDRVDELDE
jgi:hypothetical protein